MGRKKKAEEGDPLAWMVTFGDLITLLLTFFVMLLSMKKPEVLKYSALFAAFGEGRSSTLSVTGLSKAEQIKELLKDSIRDRTLQEMSEDQKLAEQLNLPFEDEGLLGSVLQAGVYLRRDARGAVITLTNDLLFKPGSAVLLPESKPMLAEAAALISKTSVPVSVEGHTDNVKPSGRGRYPDNWQLSLARAKAVLDAVLSQDKIRSERFRLAALGDTRPLVPNDSPGRRAMNRRTEIVLMTGDL
jgi:chemotaxis protein MotB